MTVYRFLQNDGVYTPCLLKVNPAKLNDVLKYSTKP